MGILTLGLNHRTAPLAVRERLALPADEQPAALARLVTEYGMSEAAVLSTCNRSELYVFAGDDAREKEAERFLRDACGVDDEALAAHFYSLRGAQAADHLFRVACGLDSLVIGESEILGQVRAALDQARAAGSAGPLINMLFQRALRAGKRARAETDIGRGRLSISSAAVELAARIFEDLSQCTALLVGAGEMGQLAARYLLDARIRHLWVANRSAARAAELAAQVDGEACPFEDVLSRLTEADIAICATAAPGVVLRADALRQVMHQRRGRPLFLIDIAVPRDVDPTAHDLDNLFVFDIDDLREVVDTHRAEREGEIRRVEQLIGEELDGFLRWLDALQAGPLIRELRARADLLRGAELERWAGKLRRLPREQRELMESILRGYANKLLHEPLVQIRDFASAPDRLARLSTVRRLFGLSAKDEDSEEERP